MEGQPRESSWNVKVPLARPGRFDYEGLTEEVSEVALVRVWIVQQGLVTGWDDGVLGFERDTFWFSGRAMSFEIAAQDILPGEAVSPWNHQGAVLALENSGLELRQGIRLLIKVFVNSDLKAVNSERWVYENFVALRQFGKPGPVSSLPPLSVRPGLIPEPRKVIRPVVVVTMLGIFFGVVGVLFVYWALPLFAVGCELLFLLSSSVATWLSSRYRGNLRRFEAGRRDMLMAHEPSDSTHLLGHDYPSR